MLFAFSFMLLHQTTKTENSTKTMYNIMKSDATSLIIAGDLSYSDGNPYRYVHCHLFSADGALYIIAFLSLSCLSKQSHPCISSAISLREQVGVVVGIDGTTSPIIANGIYPREP